MRMRDTRLWVVAVALAFLALWCAGVGVAYAAPAQEPLPEPAQAVPSAGAQAIGALGWALVAIGFLGVALTVFLSGRSKKKRRSSRASGVRVVRSVYSVSPPCRYNRGRRL